tara:strand:+ start:9747 stop:10601 length:855 start_codon:yes stop_codon:yes gene_type:complete
MVQKKSLTKFIIQSDLLGEKEKMRPLKLNMLLSLIIGLVVSGAAYAQGWFKYVSEQDQFIVNFPSDPEVIEEDYVTEFGATIPSRIYSVQNPNGRYAITVIDYTVAEQAHEDLCLQIAAETDIVSPNTCRGRGHFRDIRGAIAYESWNIRKRNSGEITYDAFGQVDGVPGHQIQILHPDQSRSFIGLYMLNQRLYLLEGTVPDDYPPPGLFQQSLGMLDEMGRRIRFEADDEGNYSRVQTRYEYVGVEDPITGEPESEFSISSDGRLRQPNEFTGAWTPDSSEN